MSTVTLYWRPLCPFSMALKRELRRAGLAHEAVNIWRDRAGAAAVRAANGGDALVPTVRVGTRMLANPSLAEVLAAVEASDAADEAP
ncbi:MAG: glutaredoxin domain-containing protein [Egibacteraceae bacterium]